MEILDESARSHRSRPVSGIRKIHERDVGLVLTKIASLPVAASTHHEHSYRLLSSSFRMPNAQPFANNQMIVCH